MLQRPHVGTRTSAYVGKVARSPERTLMRCTTFGAVPIKMLSQVLKIKIKKKQNQKSKNK